MPLLDKLVTERIANHFCPFNILRFHALVLNQFHCRLKRKLSLTVPTNYVNMNRFMLGRIEVKPQSENKQYCRHIFDLFVSYFCKSRYKFLHLQVFQKKCRKYFYRCTIIQNIVVDL